jgi:hypothetical protein
MTRSGARWRGLAVCGVEWRWVWRQGLKGRKGWRDKGQYGWVVVGDCFTLIFSASIFVVKLAAISGIAEFLRAPRMAGQKPSQIP